MYVASGAEDSVLDQSLVPFRAKALYLRLVNTTSKALDYAAAGFHVSATRGLSGGCLDAANSFNGTSMAACDKPLGRSDLTAKWASAAKAYLDAYRTGSPTTSQLRSANAMADIAYAGEGVPPPMDPKTGESEAPLAFNTGTIFGLPWWLVVGGAAAAVFIAKKKKRGKRR